MTVIEDRAEVRRLPDGYLPCLSCGVAVAGDGAERERVTALGRAGYPKTPSNRMVVIEMTRCPDCAALRERARALLEEHPRVSRAIGSHEIAVHRVECALVGVQVLGARLGQLGSDKALPLLLSAMVAPGASARWAARFAPVVLEGSATGTCGAARWSHVSTETVAALRDAYGAYLRALTERPAALRPPDGNGCLFCGIGSVTAPPSHSPEVWHRCSALPSALGGQGAERLAGYLCPTCWSAVEEVGSMGPSAMERALLMHLGVGRTLAPVALVALVAWGVQRAPQAANRRPWEHVPNLAALADELRGV